LFFYKRWVISLKRDHFYDSIIFILKTTFSPNNPSKIELPGFIQPNNINPILNEIPMKREDTIEDLSIIRSYLDKRTNYTKDITLDNQTNYWQTPLQTLERKTGDCEDFSTLLLSLFLAYNSSLPCYNLVLDSHVTTFCNINDLYIYYDQNNVELKREINQNPNEELIKLRDDFLDFYEINLSDASALYAFRNNDFIEFENNEALINWQISLKNKDPSNQSLDIEKILLENKNILKDNIETSVLRTQRPEEFNWTFIIISVFVLLVLIILVFVLLKR
jgi:hypothetical protein